MKLKILFVCLGNICRSPMAEGLMKSKIQEKGIADIEVDSAGTSNYHLGESPDRRMLETAANRGIILTSRARQFQVNDFDEFDYIIAMDKDNYDEIISRARNEEDKEKVMLMRDFDEESKGSNVPDPYFGGQSGFEDVFDILDHSTSKMLEEVLQSRS